jgi:hypothetical protein
MSTIERAARSRLKIDPDDIIATDSVCNRCGSLDARESSRVQVTSGPLLRYAKVLTFCGECFPSLLEYLSRRGCCGHHHHGEAAS